MKYFRITYEIFPAGIYTYHCKALTRDQATELFRRKNKSRIVTIEETQFDRWTSYDAGE